MNKLLFSITMKCSRLRNGVVRVLPSLMHSPFFVFLNVNVLIVDSKREMDQRWYERSARVTPNRIFALALDVLVAPTRQCGDDYWKESIGRMFSVSVTLLIILKMLRLDKCTILYMTQIFFCPIWTIQKSKCLVNICFLTRWTPLEVCLFRVALEFVSLVYLTRRAHVTLLMSLFACAREWVQMKEKQTLKNSNIND